MFYKIKPAHYIIIVSALLTIGCATYYQKSLKFQQHFVRGEFVEANNQLDKNKKAEKKNDRLLYFWQKGVVLQMLGEFNLSNEYFEKAYYFTEDYRKSYSREFASFLVNPNVKPYTGEDHELVLMHYYKAINFLSLNQLDAAMVECKRINNKLNLLNDRYENKKNRYKQDAFGQNLMGIIYEASGDVNNAFIAYRNAHNAYEEIYKSNFGVAVPEQLKKDLLRTAYLNGFRDELERFEKAFNMKYTHQKSDNTQMVFFWHNGLGPVKDEWSINFAIVKGQGGMVVFENEELGLSFPFYLPSNGTGSGGFGDLKMVRVAFPKYIERPVYYNNAKIVTDSKSYNLELAQNINAIAFKTLEDRMIRELSTSLLRLAVKQFAEYQVRTQDQNLGALVSIVNAVSEKADTRNWQTLPYSISYARVPLQEGDNKFSLHVKSSRNGQNMTQDYNVMAKKGKTHFFTFHNLETIPIGMPTY